MSRRNWQDDARMVGPYGVPEEQLTQAQKDMIDAGQPPVPDPDPALAYRPDGSVAGRVIGWAEAADGRRIPVLSDSEVPE